MEVTILWLLSLGHAVVDVMQGALPIILKELTPLLDLTYTQIGLVSLAFTLSSAVIQPLFGYLSDRYPMTWLLFLGVLLAGGGMMLATKSTTYFLLLFFVILSGLGVASYHPEGSKITNFISREGKKGTYMSVYSLGGNIGVGFGPVFTVFLFSLWGLNGSLGFFLLALAMTLLIALAYPHLSRIIKENSFRLKKSDNLAQTSQDVPLLPLILLILYIFVRSWIHAGLLTYIPFYFEYFRGMPSASANILLSAFLFAGALGTLLGGFLVDRFGEKKELLGSMVFSAVFLFLFLRSSGTMAYIWGILLGMALISTFATTVVFGQRLMPNSIGMASGLMLGFSVGAGSIGSFLIGYIADIWGLINAMQLLTLLPIVGIFLAYVLPEKSSAKL